MSPKLKPPPRAATLFSCGIFRNCTQCALNRSTTPPTTTNPTAQLQSPPPPPPPSLPAPPTTRVTAPTASSSSSSSSSASQSFTQWRLPVHQQSPSPSPPPPQTLNPTSFSTISETYHSAELHFQSGAPLQALRLLEGAFTPDPSIPALCPPRVMSGVVSALLDSTTARPASKVLLALLLNEGNRAEAVRAGAAEAALEAIMVSGPSGAIAERGLAALELLCTITDGAVSVRNHQMAVVALTSAVEGMGGRGRECAIGVLAAIYGGNNNNNCEGVVEVPTEVARVVVAAMQGECSPRGMRKGAQLLPDMLSTYVPPDMLSTCQQENRTCTIDRTNL